MNFIFSVKETKKFGFCSQRFYSLNRLEGVNTNDNNNKNIWLDVSKSTSQDRGMKFREKWLFSSELTLFLETEVKILQWQTIQFGWYLCWSFLYIISKEKNINSILTIYSIKTESYILLSYMTNEKKYQKVNL